MGPPPAHTVSFSTAQCPLEHGENYGSCFPHCNPLSSLLFPSSSYTTSSLPHSPATKPLQSHVRNDTLLISKEKRKMDIELVKCECCGLKEDCTQDYISEVKANFDGKWLCGLCSEAVRDEVNRGKKQFGMDEAMKAHMSFCRKYKSNPAIRVADGMRQMLRRRSEDTSSSSTSSSKKHSKSASTSQVGDDSSFSYY